MTRTLPSSTECEQGLLGAILWQPDLLNDCVVKIGDSEAFHDLKHELIYRTLVELANEMKPIEVISLQKALKEKKMLDQVGGIPYLSSLQDGVPSAANLPYYLETVLEKRDMRKLIATCRELAVKAYDSTEATALLDEAERAILAIRNVGSTESEGIKSLVKQATHKMQEMLESGGKITGMSTGLPDVDGKTDGLHGGEMIVVAAYPSVGKTAMCLQLGVHAAELGNAVAVFSCEMMPAALTMRAILTDARVNRYDIRDGLATQDDYKRITNSTVKISKLPLFIENSNGWSIGQVLAKCRRLKQQHNIKLVIIDYIQLLSADAGSREQEVSAISKGIKAIANQLNVCVLALSQLNDDGKLRESRAIGQDADSVWKLEMKGDWEPREQPIILRFEKNREGETGNVELLFRKTITRFESVSKIEQRDYPK